MKRNYFFWYFIISLAILAIVIFSSCENVKNEVVIYHNGEKFVGVNCYGGTFGNCLTCENGTWCGTFKARRIK